MHVVTTSNLQEIKKPESNHLNLICDYINSQPQLELRSHPLNH